MIKLLAALSFLFAQGAMAQTDVLNVGISSEFENLNPVIASQAATKYILYLAQRPIVILNPDLKWEPLLIKEIPTLKNKMLKKKGEGMELTMEFKPEAQWGDGVPVTCKDFDFAVKVGKSTNVSIPSRDQFNNIASVTWDEKNPKKCTVSYVKAKYDYFVTFPDLLPEHVEGPVFAKWSSKSQGYDQNSLYTKQPANPGLYNGPYLITEVKLGSHVTLKPNPNFKGKKPAFKQINIKLIPNSGTLEANLRSGNVNMLSSAGGLSLDQAITFEKKIKEESLPYKNVFEDGVIYAHIDLNMANPILADVKVRKALSHAFNKQEMLNALLEGKGKVAHHFVTDKDPWFTEDVTRYDYSRRKAGKLLDEAGWKMGPDGIRTKDGKKLALTIMGAAGVKLIENIEAYMQEQYKAVGVQLNIKNEPARVFFGETLNHRKFDMALYSWVSVPENSPRSMLYSKEIPTEKNSYAGQNYTGYSNPQVDKWIDELEAELDSSKRAAIAKNIVKQYAEDVPVIPVYYRPNNSVVPDKLKGYRLTGTQYYETLYVEQWHF